MYDIHRVGQMPYSEKFHSDIDLMKQLEQYGGHETCRLEIANMLRQAFRRKVVTKDYYYHPDRKREAFELVDQIVNIFQDFVTFEQNYIMLSFIHEG